MNKVRHVLGISGGKDSAALAIYMHKNYPEIDIEYYTCDTGKELNETYDLIDNLQVYLGKTIHRLQAFDKSFLTPFDHKLSTLGGFLPSATNRWCTKYLKLDLFEKFIGNDPVVSYVGIRGDEERTGYISGKSNIQSIFPFRQNIWSDDVMDKAFNNVNLHIIVEKFNERPIKSYTERFREELLKPVTPAYPRDLKIKKLLGIDVLEFNFIIGEFLKYTNYPLASIENYPLLNNDEVLIRKDIFEILENSNVGVPQYYKPIKFEIDGLKGEYSRSRSGCFFCFYQQKIEWVWLYEQHPDLFQEAMEYEKDDSHTWSDGEKLSDLIKPDRIRQIKLEYLKKNNNAKDIGSPYLIDLLDDAEEEGCATCFI